MTRLCQNHNTISFEVEHQLVTLFEQGLSWLPILLQCAKPKMAVLRLQFREALPL